MTEDDNDVYDDLMNIAIIMSVIRRKKASYKFENKHTYRVTPNDRSEAAFSSDICNDVLTSSPSAPITSATTQGYFSSLLNLPDQNLSDDLLNDLVYSFNPTAPVEAEDNIFDGSFETFPFSTSTSRERENVDITGPSTSFNPSTVTTETPTKQFFEALSPLRSRSLAGLESLELSLASKEKALFNNRFENKIESEEPMYNAWLTLKQATENKKKNRKVEIEQFCLEHQTSKAARRELFQLPTINKAKKTKPKTKKELPLNLSSDDAIGLLEESLKKKEANIREKQKKKDERKILRLSKTQKKNKKRIGKKQSPNERSMTISEDIYTECCVQFSGGKDEPRWVECDNCDRWYHVKCTHLDPNLTQHDIEQLIYLCHNCE
ncbi:unnamed protein product [Clavelina lepadiformis]|uniref:PHD-type domain-containing protein n=1 Tax=Clavelina lepadiformis TaxID=159417 RepID=A0ABP0GCU1_CLALP